jgi:hypothetical protein
VWRPTGRGDRAARGRLPDGQIRALGDLAKCADAQSGERLDGSEREMALAGLPHQAQKASLRRLAGWQVTRKYVGRTQTGQKPCCPRQMEPGRANRRMLGRRTVGL